MLVRTSLLPAFAAPSLSVAMSAGPRKLHVARCIDKPGALETRKANRTAHLEWAAASHVEFGGPFVETGAPAGSLLVMDGGADAVAAALALDPYAAAGLFESADVRAWALGMQSPRWGAAGAPVFCVWCVDKEGVRDTRAATRPAHLQWWKDSGRNGMIGPFPAADGNGAVGSMIVCEGESLEEVKAWAETDPYNGAGMFDVVHVHQMTRSIDKLFDATG